jgi:hypothetical protein
VCERCNLRCRTFVFQIQGLMDTTAHGTCSQWGSPTVRETGAHTPAASAPSARPQEEILWPSCGHVLLCRHRRHIYPTPPPGHVPAPRPQPTSFAPTLAVGGSFVWATVGPCMSLGRLRRDRHAELRLSGTGVWRDMEMGVLPCPRSVWRTPHLQASCQANSKGHRLAALSAGRSPRGLLMSHARAPHTQG